ncbi:MAG: RlmE family RNA methyltransferase [Phycisphaerales bacterium]
MARRVLQDEYFKRAKAEGYVARSAYKLLEINERKKLIRPGDRVLDLGCAPGSWLQVAAQLVGDRGRVVGLDLQRVTHAMGANVTTIVGDVDEVEASALTQAGGGIFDAVISDMAPSTSGHGDHFRSVRLCRTILGMLPEVLRKGGSLAMKVLEGEEMRALVRETDAEFEEARAFKPKASRDVSTETYIVAKGFMRPGSRS